MKYKYAVRSTAGPNVTPGKKYEVYEVKGTQILIKCDDGSLCYMSMSDFAME